MALKVILNHSKSQPRTTLLDNSNNKIASKNSLAMNSQTINQVTTKAGKASTMQEQKYGTQSNLKMSAQNFAKKFSQKVYESLPNGKEYAEHFNSGMLTQEG